MYLWQNVGITDTKKGKPWTDYRYIDRMEWRTPSIWRVNSNHCLHMNFTGAGTCIHSFTTHVFDIFFLPGGLLIIWSCRCLHPSRVTVFMWANVDDIIEENEAMTGLFYSLEYCITTWALLTLFHRHIDFNVVHLIKKFRLCCFDCLNSI